MLTRGGQVTGVAVCSLCLTWISISLRFYTRIRINRFFGLEDWLTVASMALFTSLCSLLLRTVDLGLGAHMASIPPSDLADALRYIFFCELLYVVATLVTKVSIGVYFLRLASKYYQRYIIYATLAVAIFYSIFYFIFLVLQCQPVNFLWSQYEGGSGSCLDTKTLAEITYIHAALSAITDWSFGILPISFVWGLKMNPSTKLSVCLVLSLGFFASTATIVRIVYIKDLTETDDYSWEGINLVKWSMVEPAMGITAAAIATLRPLFASFLSAKWHVGTRHKDGRNNVNFSSSQYAYSSEFAELLGLERAAVRTVIYAGDIENNCRCFRLGGLRGVIGKKAMRAKRMWKIGQNEDAESSTTDLNVAFHEPMRPASAEAPDWTTGITKTTVITISNER